MCSQTTCQNCSKPTWKGCGQHIDQALADVPVNERCTCRETAPSAPSGGLFARWRRR